MEPRKLHKNQLIPMYDLSNILRVRKICTTSVFLYALILYHILTGVYAVSAETAFYSSPFLAAYLESTRSDDYKRRFLGIHNEAEISLPRGKWRISDKMERSCEEYAVCSFYENVIRDINGHIAIRESEGDKKCVMKDAACYEYAVSECIDKVNESSDYISSSPCQYDYVSILRDYDNSIFSELPKLFTAMISLRQSTIEDIASQFQSTYLKPSLNGNEGRLTQVALKFMDPFAEMMEAVDGNLLIRLNSTRWEQFKDAANQGGGAELMEKLDNTLNAVGRNQNGLALFSLIDADKIASFFVFPQDFNMNLFLSTVNWQGGILSNLLNDNTSPEGANAAYEAIIKSLAPSSESERVTTDKRSDLFRMLGVVRYNLVSFRRMLSNNSSA